MFVILGKKLLNIGFMAAFIAGTPVCVLAEYFGAWKFGEIEDVCVIAVPSEDPDSARVLNIMVTDNDFLVLYILFNKVIPAGNRHFNIQVEGAPHWFVGSVENSALVFNLNDYENSTQLITEIIDGNILTLNGGFGEEVDFFSLNGSAMAIAQLLKCSRD